MGLKSDIPELLYDFMIKKPAAIRKHLQRNHNRNSILFAIL